MLGWSRRAMAAALAASALPSAPHTSVAALQAVPAVRLYGPVDQDSCAALADQLLEVDAVAVAVQHPVCLHIQSLGGDLLPTLHLLDVMDSLQSPVWTFVDGYAASAATLISVSGQRRFMGKRSRMLVHELRTSIQGPYTQVLTDVRHAQELMRVMTDVYEARTRMDGDALAALMKRDVWLSAEECLLLGLVDQVR